jgi:hypothetical protein
MLGEPKGWSGWVPKISPSPGFDLHTVQPEASLYTELIIMYSNCLLVYNASSASDEQTKILFGLYVFLIFESQSTGM